MIVNIHSPKSSQTKFSSWEFRGKPFKCNGKMWMKAKNKIFHYTWYYSFDEDEIYDSIDDSSFNAGVD